MDPSIPVDIVEHIIDQAANDPRFLRRLALTCSQFLPRSRYHLLAWHVCLRDRAHLEEFCAYLHTNPRMRPIIRAVKLWIPCDMSEKESLETQGLLSTIYIPLLILPNLQRWSIQPWYCVTSDLLGFGPDQLAHVESYTTSITTLDVTNILFMNATEFMRFLLAFPILRSLRLQCVNLQDDVMGMTFGPAKERLAKQLRLTSLEIKDAVDRSVMVLLLEIGRSTIQDLKFELMSIYVPDRDRKQIYDLVCGMQALRSITMKIDCDHFIDDSEQQLVDAWEITMRLPASPPRTHTISVTTLGYLDFALAKGLLVEKSRQIQQFFLGQTSHSVVFTASRTKRRKRMFWATTLGRYFPELYEQGRLRIRCDESSNAYNMTGHDSRVDSLAVSPDCKWIASGSLDTTIILWDTRRGSIVQEWLTYAGNVNCLAFSPDSRLLASGSDDRSLIIWDISEGCKRVATLDGHTHIVVTCAWSPDGTLLASGDWNGTVRVWDTYAFTLLHFFDSNANWRQYVHFSPDGCWLAFLETAKSCKIWDITNRRVHKTLQADKPFSPYAAFDPLSKRIAIAVDDDMVCIWDVERGEELLILRGHKGDITCDAFSPNGDWVLSASESESAKLWDSHTGESILSFEGHTGGVHSASFSPDGEYVASGSSDKTVRLWRTSDGSCINTFTGHTGWVTFVLFSPDGETLCSGASDGTVFIRQVRDIIL